ncbi:hypothetical protein V5O48_018054 [Marasmius crinis-equi]|uniref:F-box domain-containing protein n=1 Tax=Marasmius crinis-equi TaxID=585013 RepID=A0ABR3EMA6_9AGAR
MNMDNLPFKCLPPSRAQQIQGMFQDTISSRERERAIASRFLNDAEKELKEIQLEMGKAERDVSAFKDKHVLSKECMETFHSPLPPIHGLPPEVLTKIFAIHCVNVPISTRVIPDIISISQVCRLWREIVLSTPSLWSDFEVTGSYYPRSSSGEIQEDMVEMFALIRKVRLFMERSKNVPLTLTLSLGVGGAKMQELLSILVESAERWKSLDIRSVDFHHPVLEPLSCRLSSLQSLTLSCHRRWRSAGPLPITLFEHCEALTSVELDTDPSNHWSLLRLPWRHLTKLETFFIDGSSLASLLQECPRLKVLKLIGYKYSNTQTISPIALSHLETLSAYGRSTPLLLGDLFLPNLTTLDFEDYGIENWIDDTHLIVEFLQRSSCTVLNLTFMLSPESIRVEETLAFLRLFPSLRTLSVESGSPIVIENFIAPFLEALSSLFPRLIALTLVADCDKESHSAFIEQLLSVVLPRDSPESDTQRPGAGIAGLRPLIISIKGPDRQPASGEDFTNIQHLRDVGLRVCM